MKSLIVVSAPSGSGKTTICRALQKRRPDWRFSVSWTTRPKRFFETERFDYEFVTEEEFRQKVERGELLEYEEVHGYFYGTPRANVEKALSCGQTLFLEVDVKGGLAVKNAYPEDTLTIFIRPPSMEELRRRLRLRGSDSEVRIETRLKRMEMEMAYEDRYDYSVVNEDVDATVEEILDIVETEKHEIEIEGVEDGN